MNPIKPTQLAQEISVLREEGSVEMDTFLSNDFGSDVRKIRRENVNHIPNIGKYFDNLQDQFGSEYFKAKLRHRAKGDSNFKIVAEYLVKGKELDQEPTPQETPQPQNETPQPTNTEAMNGSEPQPSGSNYNHAMFMAQHYQAELNRIKDKYEALQDKHESLKEKHRDLKLDHNTQQQKFDLQLKEMAFNEQNSLNGVVDKVVNNQELMGLVGKFLEAKAAGKQAKIGDAVINDSNLQFIESVSQNTAQADAETLSMLNDVVTFLVGAPTHLKKTYDTIMAYLSSQPGTAQNIESVPTSQSMAETPNYDQDLNGSESLVY